MMIFKRPSNELSTYDKLVYAILCGHANRDGNAMLYVRTIAEEASCSERQAQRALSNLETRGLLIRKPQTHNGRQTFNVYEVYGFSEYNSLESSAKPASKLDAERVLASGNPGVQDSHPCRSDTPAPSDSHPRGDCEAELNNVFKQLLKNIKENTPLPPLGEKRRGEKPKNKNNMAQSKKRKGPKPRERSSSSWS
jgi:predicted transcriptional regulator